MKDIVLRGFTVLLGLGLLGYVIWLITLNAIVVTPDQEAYNMAALVLGCLIGVAFIALVVRPSIIPDNRFSLALFGLAILFFAHLYLQDNASAHIYLADILKLCGVFLIIVGPTKMLLPQAVQEEREEAGVEIIEV